MVRRKVEVRREEILTATIGQIEARGMSQVRVGDVARALGVSSGLVFYHFATKDALFVAALEFAVERDLARLDRTLARGNDSLDRLRRVIAAYGPTGSAPGWTLWIDAWSTALREPTIRTALRRLDDRWRQALQDVVRDGRSNGEFHCADPAASVARIGGLLDGLSVAVLVYRSLTRKQLRAWVREATAAELGIDAHALA